MPLPGCRTGDAGTEIHWVAGAERQRELPKTPTMDEAYDEFSEVSAVSASESSEKSDFLGRSPYSGYLFDLSGSG